MEFKNLPAKDIIGEPDKTKELIDCYIRSYHLVHDCGWNLTQIRRLFIRDHRSINFAIDNPGYSDTGSCYSLKKKKKL